MCRKSFTLIVLFNVKIFLYKQCAVSNFHLFLFFKFSLSLFLLLSNSAILGENKYKISWKCAAHESSTLHTHGQDYQWRKTRNVVNKEIESTGRIRENSACILNSYYKTCQYCWKGTVLWISQNLLWILFTKFIKTPSLQILFNKLYSETSYCFYFIDIFTKSQIHL